MGAGGWEWEEAVEGAGRRGMAEEVVEVLGAGRGGEEVAEEEAAAGAAGSGGRPAQGAGNVGRATAAGRGGTTTRWSRHPVLMPTATW